MNDQEEKRTTLVHDRFQACCLDGCGFLSGHQKKSDAIDAALRHGERHRVEVWDAMARDKSKDIVWSINP